MDSCPYELWAYEKAHQQKLEEKDRLIHLWMGNYGLSALVFAIEHCLHGDKATSTYIKKPLLSNSSKETSDESNELVAVYEMKQRTKMIEKMGLPTSPK